MSSPPDTLVFHFTSHADSILTRMNTLRQELLFCDVTLLVGGPARPLYFHGHRVVFAASSDFLRDQFLLHDGCAELNVGVVSSVEVGRRLLLSCYTGLLEVPLRELVNFLTAASALQMRQAVEKCAQAVSQYLSPTLQLNRPSEEKEVQQTESTEGNRHAARPGTSNQEVRAEECEPQPTVSGTPEEDHIQGREEVRDKSRDVLAPEETCVGDDYCVNTLESEGGEEIQPDHKASSQAADITGDPKSRQNPVQTCISPETTMSSAPSEDSSDSSKKQDILEEEEEKREERVSVQRPSLCRRCDRVFQDLQSYLAHLKEHRQYLCLVCGKGFSQRSDLTRHIQVHMGVKLFRCPLCHKTFSHKATLQEHLSLHTGHTPQGVTVALCSVHTGRA